MDLTTKIGKKTALQLAQQILPNWTDLMKEMTTKICTMPSLFALIPPVLMI
jgi:hypothetical protein